ncbi:MAG: DUF1064 domain-containing protein [Bacteroidota bacterium]
MSKYKNKKVEIDGYKFDSIKEGNKYIELKNLKVGGIVKDFTVHPKFSIIEAFEKDGVKHRVRYYIADFDVYYADGMREIIDIKPYIKKTGKYFLTAVFLIKARLFDLKYPDLTLVIE